MAIKVKDLQVKSKGTATTNDVLLVVNKKTGANSQFSLTDVFPKLQNGKAVSSSVLGSLLGVTAASLYVGGGYSSSLTGSENNTLIFKGFRLATSTTVSGSSPLFLKEETDSGNVLKGNIVLGWDASSYELSNFSNTSTGFLTSVNLASNVTGTLPVSRGGTGITTVADKAVIITQDSGTDTLSALAMSTNGQLLMGGTSGPAVGTLTAGTNMTITNADGAITLASAIGTIGSTLNMSNNKLQMGTGWITQDGGSEGLLLDSAGKTFIGSSTPTAYHADDLNVNSSITLGDTNGTIAQYIRMRSTSTGGSPALSILGATTTVAGQAGGSLSITAGAGAGSGNGGALTLGGGIDGGSGTDGGVAIKINNGTVLNIDANTDVSIKTGHLVIVGATKGIVHTNSGAVTQASNHATGVTINATSGIIQLAAVALANATNAEFTVTNSTVQADSVILLTIQDENTTNNAQLSVATHTITGGSFKISIHHSDSVGATSATASKIHFLIINNSV